MSCSTRAPASTCGTCESSAHQIVRVGLGMGGSLWESSVASTMKDMACRAPLHTHRSPAGLLVLPGSCAGGEGRWWEAAVRPWGDVAGRLRAAANTSPSAADTSCAGSADRLVLHGTAILEHTPCTVGVRKALSARKKCLRSYFTHGWKGPRMPREEGVGKPLETGRLPPQPGQWMNECVVFCPHSPRFFSWLS